MSELYNQVDTSSKQSDKHKINIIKEDPKIYTIDNFLDDSICNHFIDNAKGKVQNALVSDNTKGYVSQGRTGQNCWVSHYTDEITTAVGNKISELVGLPLCNAEAYQVIYYNKTQEYRQHYDAWNHDGSVKSRRCMKFGGQRMITALCYLNTVEEGGGTKFTKLNLTVPAVQGKILVFHNTYPGTNKKHDLSEHAGMPVIKGEKWAFNLWFREDDRKKIVYNPPLDQNQIDNNMNVNNNSEQVQLFDNKNIITHEKAITNEIINQFNQVLNFNTNQNRANLWIQNSQYKQFITSISELTKTDPEYYDNMCFVQYPKKWVHGQHPDAFDTNTPNSKVIYEKGGQRIKTIVGFITDGIEYTFPALHKSKTFKKGDILVYNNTLPLTNKRNNEMNKIIKNNIDTETILFYIFVRERPKNTNYKPPAMQQQQTIKPIINTPSNTQNITKPVISNENYMNTLQEVYKLFNNNSAPKSGLKSLTFAHTATRRGWPLAVKTIETLSSLRKDNTLLNKLNFTDKYKNKLDEFHPVIIENTLNPEAIKCISDYYHEAINNGVFELGDRQSNRYKSRNCPISRMMQYELLPLVEFFTGQKLRPTYTYLSCYINKCDLPAHTDQQDCQYTMSYIISKPENSSWPIYVDLNKQPKKNRGRYPYTPSKEKAIPCDCNTGGIMCFNGTDHIHWRETLDAEYYYVALLHYRRTDDTEY
tara:strand:+ start:20047 stop:22155 length:2109 start_codon:yes stop_codon:yes gene_type:complete